MKLKNHKPVLPKRLCLEPNAKYHGRVHRGCCPCYVANYEMGDADGWSAPGCWGEHHAEA